MLLVFMLINFGDKAILGLAAKPIMKDLGLTASQYGILSSAFFALFSISAIVVGFVTNRVQTKWVLAVLAVVWALTQLPMLLNVGFVAILVSRVVLGAAEGPANPLAMHAVQKWFPNERRALPCSIINLGASLGVVVLAPLMTSIIIAYGWRLAFFAMFAIGLVWVVAWMVVGREGTYGSAGAAASARPEAEVAAEPPIPYRRLFLCGTSLSVLFSSFAAYWALAIMISWLPVYLEGPLGHSPRATGLLIVLPWGVSGALILAQGFLTDALMRRGVSSRVARGLLGAGCVLTAATAMLLLPVAPAGGLALAAVTVAFAVGGLQFAIGSTMIGEITPVRQRAAVLATMTGLYTTAGLIAPYVTGRLVQAGGGADEAAGFNTAFVVAGVLMLAGGISAALFARPERDAARVRAGSVPHLTPAA
ncbi:MFS transporter [Rhodococcus olei]